MLQSSEFAVMASRALKGAVSASGCARSCAEKTALGSSVKTFEKGAAVRRESRLAKFAAKRASAEILRSVDAPLAARISACCYVAHAGAVTLQEVRYSDGSKGSAVGGVVTCQSVWACPVCSERIASERRLELNELLAWSRGQGHVPVMLTLTTRHDRATALAPFVEDQKKAFARVRQSGSWRKIAPSIVGSVVASEVTHGGNGWHPHLHVLLIVKGGADALALVETLRPEWVRQLSRLGRDGSHAAAFQVQGAAAAGEYIAKFGAAEELALGHAKQGRGAGSRSPWQLLADARDGDKRAAALFSEYALAFKGKRQLVWSKGLKSLSGVDQIDPNCTPEGVGDDRQEVSRVVVRSWPGNCPEWRAARRRLCALRDAVETGACLDLAEFGPTDAARWRDALAASQVLEA